jgi:3-phosphoshikimate 1-carboxyvinyltransferase
MTSEPLVIPVPASKSLTQRALIVAALAPGVSRIQGPLDCDDSRHLRAALEALGVSVRATRDGLEVRGGGPLAAPARPLVLGNAGTAVRFTAALALLAGGPVTLDGVPAMRRRPLRGLLAALRSLGVRVESLGAPGCVPVTLHPPADLAAAPARIGLDASASSQLLSALLLVAPRLPQGLEVEVAGPLPSAPYVDLTVDVLRGFGASVTVAGGTRFRVAPGGLRANAYAVEGDWSSASYPLAAGHLLGRAVVVPNAPAASHQGDRVFPDLLRALVGPGPRALDLHETPDVAPTVATCALFAAGETTLSGLATLRVKESDRLAVLTRGFRAVGAAVEERPDGLRIVDGPTHGDVVLDPEGDHRMAMCFALLGLRLPGVRVADPGCVTKSYAGFFEMLARFAAEPA